MQFDEVIAPLTRQDFLSGAWGKAFRRLRGAPGRFAHLLTWDELNAALEQHRLAPPRFRLVRDGRPLDPGLYMGAGIGGAPRIHSGKTVACLADGATLILECVEELAPRVRALSESFREVLGAGNYVNLYAGWHSQNGFDLHWDSQDTVILQLSGRKRWQLFAPTREHPLQEDVETPPQPTGEPAWDGLLEDGDALYIPRGWWHMAYPVNEPSLHLTVATVPPHGVDLLQWVVAGLRHHVEVRRDLPMLEDAAGQAAYLQTLRRLVAEALDDDVVADFRREWEGDSIPGAHIRLPSAPYQQFAPLEDDSTVRLAAAHRLAFAAAGEDVEFRADGVTCVVPAALTPALEMLTDTRAFSLRELVETLDGTASAADLKTSLATLARAGIVLVEKA